MSEMFIGNIIYRVNDKAFQVYCERSQKDKDSFQELFTIKNPTIEIHKDLVLENLSNFFEAT